MEVVLEWMTEMFLVYYLHWIIFSVVLLTGGFVIMFAAPDSWDKKYPHFRGKINMYASIYVMVCQIIVISLLSYSVFY